MIKNNTIRKEWPLPQDHYCANNFNNLGRAFVVLFDLLVVNQWHVLTEGFVVAAASRWVRLYFVAFHLTTVIVVLNIFTAFVLEVISVFFFYSFI
jgi:hypothetical protein